MYFKREAFWAVMLTAALFMLTAYFSGDGAVKATQADMGEEVFLPVIMYHSVLKDPGRTGEYVITPDSLESDLIYLKKNGYTAVSGAEVFAFVNRGEPLPQKPVMITFDDGHLNNLTYAGPLMEKYGFKCTVSTVGAFTVQAEKENDPNPYYAYLTGEDIREMAASGLFEIGCHTYNLHSVNGRRGAEKNPGEDAGGYADMLVEDVKKWREVTGCGSGVCVYAFPYGYCSEESFGVLNGEGFTVFLTCREAGNYISYSGADFVKIDRYNRSGLVQTDKFMEDIGI
ncbi:MAG: polysaccharide deacetylase family protein [Ruminococcus sp.]|nr:polysaccharide deacetylase family protein [Ruminococcus sp.]